MPHATKFALLFFASAVWSAAPSRARQIPESPKPLASAPAKNDYSDAATWVCRPGHNDPCTVDISSTVITADGKLSVERFKPNPRAPIDCFYLYPTISTQPAPNSDMTLGLPEQAVVRAQLERFSSECRLYAPLYRQITLLALRDILRGAAPSPEVIEQERALAYGDVLDAFHSYMEHDNRGRGFVLIGHSQGSTWLTQLIRDEIDGKPVAAQLVSALLLGTSLPVPKGRDVGGAFQHIPLCHAPTQIGCVITYASFRATAPPPPGSRYGHVKDESMISGCTNPAALGGGSGELHAYLPAADGSNVVLNLSAEQASWVTPPQPIATPFVSLPGMLTAECVHDEHGSYLAVTVHDDPSGPRAHDIPGDLVVMGHILPEWGLHLIDVNLAIGNLVNIVRQQSAAYLAQKK